MAFFGRTISSTGCTPEHVVTHKATFYPSAIRAWAPTWQAVATGADGRQGDGGVHVRAHARHATAQAIKAPGTFSRDQICSRA
jgi:hypothetical protein